jgi:hypothetical protein
MIFRTMLIDHFDGVLREEALQRLFRRRRTIFPQCSSESIPHGRESHFVGIRVLDDQPVEFLRVPTHNAKADWATIVLHVQAVVIESLGLQEALGDCGEFVEGIRVLLRIGRVTVAETRVIGRNHMEA